MALQPTLWLLMSCIYYCQRYRHSTACSTKMFTIITSPVGVVAKFYDEYVCLSVREDTSGTRRDLYPIFVHAAYVRGSVLLQHVLTIGCITYRREGVTRVHSTGKVQSTIALFNKQQHPKNRQQGPTTKHW